LHTHSAWQVVCVCAGKVNCLDFSSDQAYLATGDDSGKLTVWETATGKQVHELSCGSSVTGVEFSNDGLMIFTSSNATTVGSVTGWLTETWEAVMEVRTGTEIICLDLARDCSLVATGGKNKQACLWKTELGETVEAHEAWRVMTCAHNVLSIKLSIDCSLLVTGDAMAKAKARARPGMACCARLPSPHACSHLRTHLRSWCAQVWDTSTGKLVHTLDCGGWVHALMISGDMTMLATGDQGKAVRLWSLVSGELVHRLELEAEVLSIDLSSDKTTVRRMRLELQTRTCSRLSATLRTPSRSHPRDSSPPAPSRARLACGTSRRAPSHPSTPSRAMSMRSTWARACSRPAVLAQWPRCGTSALACSS
jgi:WD40 repeat protein